jgi:hypothetical protein
LAIFEHKLPYPLPFLIFKAFTFASAVPAASAPTSLAESVILEDNALPFTVVVLSTLFPI